MKPKTEYTITYRVLNESGKTLGIIKETGFSKLLIQAKASIKMVLRYGYNTKLQRIKITSEIV